MVNHLGNWKNGELGDFVTLKRGFDLPQQKREDGQVPIFSSSGITGTHSTAMVKAPGVITGRYGTIGEVFYAAKDFWPLNTTLFVEDFHGNDAKFIYYFLKTLEWSKFTSASAVPGINRNTVHKEIVSLPDIETQRRIASTLSMFDEKIKINTEINDNLMQQAVTIFKSWFVEYSPFDGIEPKEWETVNLEKITSLISRGIAPKYSDNSDQIVINQKCIRNHMIDLSQARTHTPKVINEKWLRFGDLLINSTGDGTLGRAAQVWFQPQNITVDSHVTVVRPAKENLIFYIGLWGVLHEREIESLHTGSTGQTELPKERVKALELHLPDNGTLDRFNTLIAPMAAAIVSKQNENNKLATLRDALLPKLMSGEIDVSAVQL